MTAFEIRGGRVEEARALVELYAAVAEERDGIASEPPIDLDARTTQFAAAMDHTIVAVAGGELVGLLHLEPNRHGFAELGMLVAREWRGRGVGRRSSPRRSSGRASDGFHKLSLEVFPHNDAGIALYRRFGFVEEGRRVKQYRRASGELWDSIVMGLLL